MRAAPSPHSSPQQYQYITLEERCIPSALATEIDNNEQLALLVNGTFGPILVSDLLDLSSGRLDSLNENNIRIQVSYTYQWIKYCGQFTLDT